LREGKERWLAHFYLSHWARIIISSNGNRFFGGAKIACGNSMCGQTRASISEQGVLQ
jgi:hypothetical protein